ncbi:MAG: type VII toxin-antitoxin system HepT family RNase toxin, partial [Deferrisomatales bacterium]
ATEEDMLNGVIGEKLQTLDQVLSELKSLGEVTAEQLTSDWRTRRAVERDLQILVEVVIDVCQRLISLGDQSPATTGADAIARCIQMGALKNRDGYRKMAQFRNFIVHRYEQVDVSVLVDMLDRKLPDFEQFRSDVLEYVRSR